MSWLSLDNLSYFFPQINWEQGEQEEQGDLLGKECENLTRENDKLRETNNKLENDNSKLQRVIFELNTTNNTLHDKLLDNCVKLELIFNQVKEQNTKIAEQLAKIAELENNCIKLQKSSDSLERKVFNLESAAEQQTKQIENRISGLENEVKQYKEIAKTQSSNCNNSNNSSSNNNANNNVTSNVTKNSTTIAEKFQTPPNRTFSMAKGACIKALQDYITNDKFKGVSYPNILQNEIMEKIYKKNTAISKENLNAKDCSANHSYDACQQFFTIFEAGKTHHLPTLRDVLLENDIIASNIMWSKYK